MPIRKWWTNFLKICRGGGSQAPAMAFYKPSQPQEVEHSLPGTAVAENISLQKVETLSICANLTACLPPQDRDISNHISRKPRI